MAKAAGILNWIKAGVSNLLDPERQSRIDSQTTALFNELVRSGRQFNLDSAVGAIQIDSSEFDLIRENVYRIVLKRGWQDQLLSESERQSLKWAGQMLQLSHPSIERLNREAALEVFERVFATAISDGVLDDQEIAWLGHIAQSIGIDTGELIQIYFRQHGEGFLRGLFLNIIDDGRITGDEWNRLLSTAVRLGFSHEQMLHLVEPQAKLFVEHVLADAISDGHLSAQEDQCLLWLLRNLRLPSGFQTYANAQIQDLRIYSALREGKMPTVVPSAGVELRAGEIPHWQSTTQYRVFRERKNGTAVVSFDGYLLMTDSRLIFTSTQKSITLLYRNIIDCRELSGGVEIRTSGRGGGFYDFGEHHRLSCAILRTAIGRANQTIVQKLDRGPDRHIPRDVRQRVWQRYGARCSECGATEYLEFDHIIPVARGGSNTDANVQLLCRRCNLKKSDKI